MTVDDIKRSDKATLTCEEVAPIVGFNPQNIRNQARTDPGMLGFPVSVCANGVRIPRAAFLKWMGVID